jgi:hypothetical protein
MDGQTGRQPVRRTDMSACRAHLQQQAGGLLHKLQGDGMQLNDDVRSASRSYGCGTSVEVVKQVAVLTTLKGIVLAQVAVCRVAGQVPAGRNMHSRRGQGAGLAHTSKVGCRMGQHSTCIQRAAGGASSGIDLQLCRNLRVHSGVAASGAERVYIARAYAASMLLIDAEGINWAANAVENSLMRAST